MHVTGEKRGKSGGCQIEIDFAWRPPLFPRFSPVLCSCFSRATGYMFLIFPRFSPITCFCFSRAFHRLHVFAFPALFTGYMLLLFLRFLPITRFCFSRAFHRLHVFAFPVYFTGYVNDVILHRVLIGFVCTLFEAEMFGSIL